MTAGTGLSRALIRALPLVFLNSVMIAGDSRIAYAGKRLRNLGPNGLPQFIKVFCGDIAAVKRNISAVKAQVRGLRAPENTLYSCGQILTTAFMGNVFAENTMAAWVITALLFPIEKLRYSAHRARSETSSRGGTFFALSVLRLNGRMFDSAWVC